MCPERGVRVLCWLRLKVRFMRMYKHQTTWYRFTALHTSMKNKQVEFNPYIYTLSKLYRFGYEISVFFNTKHPVIILWASLFVVTPSHVASSKIGCQFISYVYRSRKY